MALSIDSVRTQMMQLWKDTFHDSDRYVNLVFDSYFKPEYVAWHEDDGKVVSALMGVPYCFGAGKSRLHGLYLCGLATDAAHRRQGIMDSLIRDINSRARKDFAFTFLIPANEGLTRYYEDRGYQNAMYRVKDRYTSVHDFTLDNAMLLDREDGRVAAIKKRYCEALRIHDSSSGIDKEYEAKIIAFIREQEQQTDYVCLQHSDKDLSAAILENEISGGRIYYATNRDDLVTGAAFIEHDGPESIIVKKIYNSDRCSFYLLLNAVKRDFKEQSLILYSYPENINRKELWMVNYSGTKKGMPVDIYSQAENVYDVSLHSRAYGMIRFLDVREILKFLAEYRRDAKFSILVKDENPDSWLYCNVRDGEAICHDITDAASVSVERLTHATRFTTQDLERVICRRKDSSSLVMEAFGIPRIPINMSLLLD